LQEREEGEREGGRGESELGDSKAGRIELLGRVPWRGKGRVGERERECQRSKEKGWLGASDLPILLNRSSSIVSCLSTSTTEPTSGQRPF
jgi:hypothetical protein